MMESRREYEIKALYINLLFITKVIIDPHVDKHQDHINDDLILSIVRELNYINELPEEVVPPYRYFKSDIEWKSNWYRLI